MDNEFSTPNTTHLIGPDTLWYRQSASRWAKALPIGNGRIGGMVFGGVDSESILLSEATCWSGEPLETNNREGAADRIPAIRAALLRGEYAAAHDAIGSIIGEKQNYGANLPAGGLSIVFDVEDAAPQAVNDYCRQLNLDQALTTTSYRVGETAFHRESFVSHPHQVLALRMWADTAQALSFGVSLDSGQNPSSVCMCASGDLLLQGQAHESIHSDGRTGVSYAIRLRCLLEDGSLVAEKQRLQVKQANAVTVLVAIATTFTGDDPTPRTLAQIDAAACCVYEELLAAHIRDHRALYSRVRLDLGQSRSQQIPTDERLQALRRGHEDPALDALMFHYGRYLLIASSRNDSPLPAHLQGAWNDNVACRIGWTCDMHLDINTQMNYWPAEVTNLSECSLPLFDWIERTLAPSGRDTARTTYSLDGWVAHIVSNAWGFSAPGWSTRWGLHPTGGAWVAMHLWDHYCFTGDQAFLAERAYPLLREAAQFFMGYLTLDAERGYLLSGPSCSPENVFAVDGEAFSNSMGNTCDTVLIRALFEACIAGGQAVNECEAFLSDLRASLAQLPPFQIGAHGQLQEWLVDYPEPDLHHRHTSHLLSLFPFGQICPERTPDLAAAAQITIDRRTTPEAAWEDTGWARSLLILYAVRLRNGDAAARHINAMQRTLADTNLMVFHPAVAGAASDVYELDGNTGLTTGIAEMLLQSHAGVIHLLPALPSSWPTGAVEGLCARGGLIVAIRWQNGALVDATIVSQTGAICRIRYRDSLVEVAIPADETFRFNHAWFDQGIV